MRWPLRNQILVRMLLLLLITIGSLTFANIRSVISAIHTRERQQTERLAELLNRSNFPLTQTVLETMKSLSGAEFVLVGRSGAVLARTADSPAKIPDTRPRGPAASPAATGNRIVAGGVPWYHRVVETAGERSRQSAVHFIHIFVPRPSTRSIWWNASRSPLLIAALILPLACLISLALASQVTRPLARLRKQVRQIADGDLQPVPAPPRNDEIRDLNIAINEMAVRLQDHENRLRQNERLRTMVQFGSGMAHHLRNSATGCRLAVELLADDHRGISDSDNYQVAIRQLTLMDNYIRKFLVLSRSPRPEGPPAAEPVDLAAVLENVIFLLRPSAKHLKVELNVHSDRQRVLVEMAEEDAEQLVMNLTGNAITAASQPNATSTGKPAVVDVTLVSEDGIPVVFSVTDSGPGPPAEIAGDLFEPFVTGSREGTGLGLSLVREIAERTGGLADWKREHGKTKFTFQFGKSVAGREVRP